MTTIFNKRYDTIFGGKTVFNFDEFILIPSFDPEINSWIVNCVESPAETHWFDLLTKFNWTLHTLYQVCSLSAQFLAVSDKLIAWYYFIP